MAAAVDPRQALERILVEHGPLSADDVEHRMRADGVSDPDRADPALLELECPIGQLVDERWVWLPAVLAGRVLSHRVSADEAAHDMLTAVPDLAPITVLCREGSDQRFADGSPATVAMVGYDDALLAERGIPEDAVAEGGVLLLEPGTLAGLGVVPGDLVALRLTAPGLAVERITAPPPSAAAGARLAELVDDDAPVSCEAAVWTACVQDPALFGEPLAPLSEIVDEAGLTHQHGSLAPAGFDFTAWRFELGAALLATRHDLDDDDAFALHTLITLHERLTLLLDSVPADGPPDDVVPDQQVSTDDSFADVIGEMGAVLADPLLAELLMAETVGTDPATAAGLGLLAEVLEPKVPREARVATRWLQAVALEHTGDVAGAERELLAAESLDTEWPLALFDLARFASDRGDAERGLALLHRAGAEPDHPLMELLQRHRVAPRSDVGRNEACWCGSGRKYKKCHLGREELPLGNRVDWLYAKAIQHVLSSEWDELRLAVGCERARYADLDDDDAVEEMLADPLILDAVLFEGGGFADFLKLRGSLLPADERGLAERWLLATRSVFEVENVAPGRGFTVRDVRTGETLQVRAGGGQLEPGQLICARALPTGDTVAILGAIEPVEPHQRHALVELLDAGPDPVALVSALTRRFAPEPDALS